MITDRNQVCFAKMVGCGLQEEVLSSPDPTDHKANLTLSIQIMHIWSNSWVVDFGKESLFAANCLFEFLSRDMNSALTPLHSLSRP